MELIKEETINHLINGSENVAKFAAGAVSQLTTEAVNLFIVEAALSILKFSVVFVIFFIVKKYCDSMAAASQGNATMFKAFKTTALVLSLIFFTTQSFPHLIQISKALVAPKIFLLEKAMEMKK